MTFDILYEDSHCIVVAKPAGLLTQAPLGIDSLEVQIKQLLKERENKPGNVYLGVPHRIDRPVSGAIVFAKNVRAARKISEQFEHRMVSKTYWALAEGTVEPDEGTWTDHLKKVYGKPRTQVVGADDPEGRIAVLHYRVLDRFPERTLLEIELETGRTHQIRIQAASRGHILLGDELYGSQIRFGPWSEDERDRLIALHARTLVFRHPMTRETISVVAPLPGHWPPTAAPAEVAEIAEPAATSAPAVRSEPLPSPLPPTPSD
ncbi:MAG: RluA family pseudouridine synthase [Pirellulaceae bacterium]|nr:RluA family pseudouridine synthase [Pirellulaceae bacterium]